MKKTGLKFIISLFVFSGINLSAQDCGVWPSLMSPEIDMDRIYLNGVYYSFSGSNIILGLNINTGCDNCRAIYYPTTTAYIENEALECGNNYALIPSDKITEEKEYNVDMSVTAHSICDSTSRTYSGSATLKIDNTPPVISISAPDPDEVIYSTSNIPDFKVTIADAGSLGVPLKIV